MAMPTVKEEAYIDPELLAMGALERYLGPLNRATRMRVLNWAKARYVEMDVPEYDLEGFTKFTSAVSEASKKMGDIPPVDIIRAALEAKRLREEADAKPEKDRAEEAAA